MKENYNGCYGFFALIIIGLIIWGTLSIKSCMSANQKKEAYELAVKKDKKSEYLSFLNKYGEDKEYIEEENYIYKVDSILWERTINSSNYDYYIENVPLFYGSYGNRINFRRAKDSIEERNWKTDSLAWDRANEINTLKSYKKYARKYSSGIKIKEAKKIIIDMEVDNIFESDYGILPEMEKTSGNSNEISYVTVFNDTSYELNLFYSGIESKSIKISSHSRAKFELKNGMYRIGASVDANVRDFAGTENLTGGNYDVEYYIRTSLH